MERKYLLMLADQDNIRPVVKVENEFNKYKNRQEVTYFSNIQEALEYGERYCPNMDVMVVEAWVGKWLEK